MSRAAVSITLELEGHPEALVQVIDHLEETLRTHCAPYVILHKCSVSARNTFARAEAKEPICICTDSKGNVLCPDGCEIHSRHTFQRETTKTPGAPT